MSKRYRLHEIKAREGADINAEYVLAADYDALAAGLAEALEMTKRAQDREDLARAAIAIADGFRADEHRAAASAHQRIGTLEAQLAERDAEICRLNMEMSVYKQGYTQKDAELVMATIKALEELKQKPLPPPPKEAP